MSYEKVFSKQFVDIGENRIIPMYLHGSSNCTQFRNGREVGEKYWSSYSNMNYILKPFSEFIDYIKNTAKASNEDSEWFKTGSKWITSKEIVKWFENGAKSAKTIEEIIKDNYNQSLKCFIWAMSKKEYKSEQFEIKYCHTTQEILDWIDMYNHYDFDNENYNYYPCFSFYGETALKSGGKVADNVSVICKIKNGYLSEITDTRLCTVPNREKAKVFASKEEFEKIALPWKWQGGYRLVNANYIPKPIKNNYVVYCCEGNRQGLYVKKVTTAHIFFSGKSNAKGFTSFEKAEKFIKEKIFNSENKYIPQAIVE